MKNIKLTNKAKKEITIITKNDKKAGCRIVEKIKLLGVRDISGKSLSGYKNLYSLRSGNYRIIYKYEGDILMIIQTVGHRRNIYENLNLS